MQTSISSNQDKHKPNSVLDLQVLVFVVGGGRAEEQLVATHHDVLLGEVEDFLDVIVRKIAVDLAKIIQ